MDKEGGANKIQKIYKSKNDTIYITCAFLLHKILLYLTHKIERKETHLLNTFNYVKCKCVKIKEYQITIKILIAAFLYHIN